MRRICIDKNGNMYAVINRVKRGWKVHVWKNDPHNHHWDPCRFRGCGWHEKIGDAYRELDGLIKKKGLTVIHWDYFNMEEAQTRKEPIL